MVQLLKVDLLVFLWKCTSKLDNINTEGTKNVLIKMPYEAARSFQKNAVAKIDVTLKARYLPRKCDGNMTVCVQYIFGLSSRSTIVV